LEQHEEQMSLRRLAACINSRHGLRKLHTKNCQPGDRHALDDDPQRMVIFTTLAPPPLLAQTQNEASANILGVTVSASRSRGLLEGGMMRPQPAENGPQGQSKEANQGDAISLMAVPHHAGATLVKTLHLFVHDGICFEDWKIFL